MDKIYIGKRIVEARSILGLTQTEFGQKLGVDHGSDFISKQAQRIGQQLNVELQYAPPATGSLKGVVERSFRSFQSEFIDLTFGAGTKNHDALSKPNREARKVNQTYLFQ